MNSEELIEEFYAAFAAGNAKTMARCYHEQVIFEDPVFGKLKGIDTVSDMWHMLMERSRGHLKIEFSEITAHGNSGTARWVATYPFSQTNRVVVNKVYASFEFKEGLIFRHTDHFDLYKWSKQAFGLKGLLLGWTGYMHRKIQEQAKLSLEKYRNGEKS